MAITMPSPQQLLKRLESPSPVDLELTVDSYLRDPEAFEHHAREVRLRVARLIGRESDHDESGVVMSLAFEGMYHRLRRLEGYE